VVRDETLPPMVRRWVLVRSLARTAAVSGLIAVAYFVLPLRPRALGGAVVLAIGLVVVGIMVVLQIRRIVRSPHPGLQAINALALTTMLFLVAFASTYFVMSDVDNANFTEPLSKLDAAYFTVTAFATVGFGDIVAKSEEGRAVVTVQMLSGLVLVGLIARVVVGAVEIGRSRQREVGSSRERAGTPE
jgi:hypothetical protein